MAKENRLAGKSISPVRVLRRKSGNTKRCVPFADVYDVLRHS